MTMSEQTFVHADAEVRKTGRTAERQLPGGRTMVLVEVTPVDEAQGTWKKFVNPQALFSIVPAPSRLREASMETHARATVLKSGGLVTASQLAELAGPNNSIQPDEWRERGQIFAVQHDGVDYYPGYGLDVNHPLASLAQVMAVFDGRKDGWGLAYWFCSENSFLGGRRPQDVLKDDPARVIAAARDEIEGVVHA